MTDQLDRLQAALADRYTIERELGRGGMAVVYLAHDQKLGRPIALKVLRPELAASLGSERFLREIEIAARLTHPNILALHDYDDADGILYYTMPFVEGESLRDRLNRQTQLSIEDALQITRDVADALGHAHGMGIVHRDIKPENILLQGGHALVSDFGIALAVTAAGGERLTETGLSLGTPAYMSPEQVAGDRELDVRSDLYSLACVLYEMLAGQPPFTAVTGRAVMARHVTDTASPITTVRSGVPQMVAAAIATALEKDPLDRFASADAFGSALRAEAGPAEPAEPAVKSIVVLPFENLSPDPDNAFFADGLTEELITDLSKVQALRVISRTSAFAFKGTTKTVPVIAGALDVRYVLEGSVRRSGNSLRIAAQLIDAATDTHMWADKYGGTLDDVFDLQERLSRQIVHQLEARLTSDEDRRLSARPLDDVEAHDICLRARLSALTMTKDGLDRAQRMIEGALALIGDNALLHATLGWIHGVRLGNVTEGGDRLMELARRHAAKAMALDPDLAWAHFVTAIVHHREARIQDFIDCAKRGLAIQRDSHALAVLGLYLAHAGRVEAGRSYAEEARDRDPLYWLTAYAALMVEVLDGRAAHVIDEMRECWERFAVNDPWSTRELGLTALHAGRENEAVESFDRIAASDNPVGAAVGRLYSAALAGNRERVLEVSASVAVKTLDWWGGHCASVGSCLVHVGEVERGLAWIEKGIEGGFTNHRFLGRHDRWLAPLRGDERFQTLLRRAREQEEALEV